MVKVTDIIAPNSIRIIAGTALPGAVGVWPYFALAYGKFPWIESAINGWPWAIVAAIIMLFYCAGMAFNSLGTTMEDAMYNHLVNKPDSTVEQHWQNYLLTDSKKFPIFHKYNGLLVTWLCFSRAMTFAILALLIGTSWHA